ncbi:hypothetical protein T484DRAFT_1758040, partial [Baffinella frigidus]
MSNRRVKTKYMVEETEVFRGGSGDTAVPDNEPKKWIEATEEQTLERFNRDVVELRPIVQRVSQEARLLDKSAAMLIAGSAGLPMRGVVWVDCNMETEWFDKNDEKKLMAVAWNDVIGEGNRTIKGHLELVQNDLGTDCPDDILNPVRIKNIQKVLKSFRKSQLSMQLYSLSPSTEAVLSGLVIDMLDHFGGTFSGLADTEELKQEVRSSVFEHDDRTRRMSRMLRRLPFTRNEFCRVAGVVLRYNISLQDGTALSTRRLNQIQLDMRRAVDVWTQFLERNLARVVYELTEFWVEHNHFYVFDWSTHRLKILDSEQYNSHVLPQTASAEEEVMNQEISGYR